MTKASSPPFKIYFENLNSIRFIAAFLVIIHHIEQFKYLFHIPNHWDNKVILIIGKLGVILFFVLSGFLISYLLFKEQASTKTISIRNFYIRRILRIWPLYFLIIALGLFILPFINFFAVEGFPKTVVWNNLFYKVALYIFFLPNVVLNVFGIIPYVSQTWSIGAEEQFYLVWPVLNKVVKNKWLLMFGVISVYLLIKFYVPHFIASPPYREIFNELWLTMPIDCMAIGGLFAIIVNETNAVGSFLKKIIFGKMFQWCSLLLTIGLVSNGVNFLYFHYEIYALLFGSLICNLAANKNRIFSLEYSWLNYLGKISYGLYMFHPIAIVCSIKLLQQLGIFWDIVLYPVTILTVFLLSALSYELFEKQFIKRKIKYSTLISGDHAKQYLTGN